MKICPHCGQIIPKGEIKTVHDLNGQQLRRDDIIEVVVKYFGYKDLSELQTSSRVWLVTYHRQVLITFLRMKTKMIQIEVARLVHRRDHTTVISGIKHINELMFSDPQVLQDVININNLLNADSIIT